MKIERHDSNEERQVLLGLITNSRVCGNVASKWEDKLFRSKYANIVARMCVGYHRKYGRAPRRHIAGLFESWSQRTKDRDTIKIVERFLSGLSEEFEGGKKINAPFLIDLAAEHFTRVKLERLRDQIEATLDAGSVEEAAKVAQEFRRIELGSAHHVDVLQDRVALERAFAERQEPLFYMPGALRGFFKWALVREGFVALLGPEKRGKTTWLCELGWQAMTQRKRVAFFSVGDESQEDLMLRFALRAAERPMFTRKIRYPVAMRRRAGKYEVKLRTRRFKRTLSFQSASVAFDAVMADKVRSHSPYLRISVHPNSSLGIRGIDDKLTEWKQEGWEPDVVIVDYLDIVLESGNSRDDMRHRINATWKDFRGLVQKWHVLGITATQANALAHETALMTVRNNSEDKRKAAHVTGMLGLNQTPLEKQRGLMRLNWILRRNADFNPQRVVGVAGCLAIGNPCVRSL